ncbi:DUF6888 family protein [Chamaesiphon polymorphus]|uniref:DUF6888 domain-containing protein n=1 Tax=Chamaesiphon polymorphus CCALA 037 TaxID=2107692 RepID=A0A2T1GL23_9CYAN|nr:hypothetical protein [Chamaesiphon polymorphus]PSB58557.1 hypothetical protein C7B77_04360 [Chamaesiphon polymorphus CCALA 037]
MPTDEQAQACLRVCKMLSNGYQPIYLFRYSQNARRIYILAGMTESIQVVIPENGQWRFIDDAV